MSAARPGRARFLAARRWIVGARVRVDGATARPHTLLIANHTSWLDILVLGGATGCAFVSKDELGHGLIHWLADQNATVYVKRSHVKGAKDQAIAIAEALEGDKPVALFPEGTTGPGTHLLPFRSTLLEAANYRRRRTSRSGRSRSTMAMRAAEVGWWQEPGKDNVLRDPRPPRHAAGDGPPARPARPLRRPQAADARPRATRSREALGLTSREPLAYRRGRNDSQDFQNQKLRLPDERL